MCSKKQLKVKNFRRKIEPQEIRELISRLNSLIIRGAPDNELELARQRLTEARRKHGISSDSIDY